MERDIKFVAAATLAKIVRFTVFLVILPLILTLNACGMIFTETRGTARFGNLTAEIVMINPGAMSTYSGSVQVSRRYVPRIWPLSFYTHCSAIEFESDPNVEITWENGELIVAHDRFAYPPITKDVCYGRKIILNQRAASSEAKMSAGE